MGIFSRLGNIIRSQQYSSSENSFETKNLTKWVTGGLGWAMFGPLGGLLGFTVGAITEHYIPSNTSELDDYQLESATTNTTSGDFALSLVVMAAAVMKADGKVVRSELDYVKAFFVQNFGVEATTQILPILKDVLEKPIPVDEVSYQIRNNMDYSSRLHLLHFLYGIANADGQLPASELNLIERIAFLMGIENSDTMSIKAMFYKSDLDAAYQILEIPSTATDDELKKAYRRMAVKYHPDKVHHLGEDFAKSAKEKFQKINEAYELIKKERGIS